MKTRFRFTAMLGLFVAAGEVAPEQVYDFTMIRALNDELKKGK